MVVGGAGGEVGAAEAFGGVFEPSQRKVLGEAESLAFFSGHVRGGGGGTGEGATNSFIGAARIAPGR